jgi:hypothetical protein
MAELVQRQAGSEKVSVPHELVIQARPKKEGQEPESNLFTEWLGAGKAQLQGFPAFLISLVDDATHAGQVWVLDRVT